MTYQHQDDDSTYEKGDWLFFVFPVLFFIGVVASVTGGIIAITWWLEFLKIIKS